MEKQKRNSLIASIRVPQFANLVMGETGYVIYITLHIDKSTADYINNLKLKDAYAFEWKHRWYVKTYKTYSYSTPLYNALHCETYAKLDYLKIVIREAKIKALKNQIDYIKESHSEFDPFDDPLM